MRRQGERSTSSLRRVAGRPGWRTRHCFALGFLFLACLATEVVLADQGSRVLRHRELVERAERAGDSVVDRCLTCHGSLVEVLPRSNSPSGLPAKEATAWYQRVPTYMGEQHNFHWRHLMSPYARQVMRPECDTCHPGFDPRKPLPPAGDPAAERPLRKRVNPAICVNCHGAYPDHREEFSGSWIETRHEFDNTCLVCHRGDAAKRHNHPLLNKESILQLSKTEPDVCYGCHGGRAWYAVSPASIRGSAFDWGKAKGVSSPTGPKNNRVIR